MDARGDVLDLMVQYLGRDENSVYVGTASMPEQNRRLRYSAPSTSEELQLQKPTSCPSLSVWTLSRSDIQEVLDPRSD